MTESGQIRTEFGFEHPHNFISKNYIKSSICNYCLQSIAGFNAGQSVDSLHFAFLNIGQHG